MLRKDSHIFESFIADKYINGRTRPYFSYTKKGMGSPRKTPNTDIYVETSFSAEGAKKIIISILNSYEIEKIRIKYILEKIWKI